MKRTYRMHFRALVVLSIASVLALSGAMAAPKTAKPDPECPYAFSDFDAIFASVAKAPTCADALILFQACGSGASSDARLGDAVVERCEKDFISKLTKAQKRAYAAEGERCDRKYANKQETMYISFTAHYHADAALKYSRRYGKAPPVPRR